MLSRTALGTEHSVFSIQYQGTSSSSNIWHGPAPLTPGDGTIGTGVPKLMASTRDTALPSVLLLAHPYLFDLTIKPQAGGPSAQGSADC